MKKLCFLIALISLCNSCSKDDICAPEEAVTPLLIITFKNFENREEPKSVPNLIIETNYTPSTLYSNQTAVDSIAIPLRTSVGNTSYRFTNINSMEGFDITDVYDFTYGREDIYVNRACGFKTIFTNLIVEENNTSSANDFPTWILDIEIQEITIENETQAHLIMYH